MNRINAWFQKNMALEDLLKELNELLEGSQEEIRKRYTKPALPPVFIVGCPRSGTTLFLQLMAYSGGFSYPSNFISRFYRAPYIGALIQKMLVDPQYDFNAEMGDMNITPDNWFCSHLGKTTGFLAPNEFWYFWRRFFAFGEIQYLDRQKLNCVDTKTFLSELAALEAVFMRPLLMKALIVNWNLNFLSEIFEQAVFVYIKRDSFFNIQSLLKARLKYFNDICKWYSFKPLEYKYLKNQEPYSQAAGQVYFTNKAIQNGLSGMVPSRWTAINYEDLCRRPERCWEKVRDLLYLNGYPLALDYKGPQKFTCMNKQEVPDIEKKKIFDSYQSLTGTTIFAG
jgi:hypothetical protein